MSRRSERLAAINAMAGDELPHEYYERAVTQLMQEVDEQRDFVHSEFVPLESLRLMLNGDLPPEHFFSKASAHFRLWIERERKFRITTMAWALYAADHPIMRRT